MPAAKDNSSCKPADTQTPQNTHLLHSWACGSQSSEVVHSQGTRCCRITQHATTRLEPRCCPVVCRLQSSQLHILLLLGLRLRLLLHLRLLHLLLLSLLLAQLLLLGLLLQQELKVCLLLLGLSSLAHTS